MAKNQPCLKNSDVEDGYYNGKEIYPRNILKIGVSLYLKKNNFCFFWQSQGVSLNKTIEESKTIFKIFDNY